MNVVIEFHSVREARKFVEEYSFIEFGHGITDQAIIRDADRVSATVGGGLQVEIDGDVTDVTDGEHYTIDIVESHTDDAMYT